MSDPRHEHSRDLADAYDHMLRLASLFDDSGEDLRRRARLGADIVRSTAFTDSVSLSKVTGEAAEDAVLAATDGPRGLLSRSVELDADALVLRATVLTYRWIDELQAAAYKTLGSIAARAIGYLAPEVALGGAVFSAGLIETDALDRDGVAAYLDELAAANPELMEHVTSGGGGLLDGLQMRALLTAGVMAGDLGRLAGQGGLRAIGVDPWGVGFDAALRDVASELVDTADPAGLAEPAIGVGARPQSLTDLMTQLQATTSAVDVRRVGEERYIAYLHGPGTGDAPSFRLVSGDSSAYAALVVRAIEAAAEGDRDPRVMLVGAGAGGVTAAELAATPTPSFVVEQVVTAGSPAAHVPRIAEPTRVLSLEDRSDPVALLGSLINAGVANRVTVVFDGDGSVGGRLGVVGGRAVDASDHPDLRAEVARLANLGYLAP